MEEPAEAPKKKGWPLGKKRGPRVYEPSMTQKAVIEVVDAPIHVKVWLKGETEPIEFGAASRDVQDGFHVFTYPSEYDRYRETRVEIAVSEVRRIEITAARYSYDNQKPSVPRVRENLGAVGVAGPLQPSRPIIHSAKEDALRRIQENLEKTGSARIEFVPGISFGDNAI